MRKIAQLSVLVLLVAFTTASTPAVPGASLVHAPLAIIEGGTVRTLPKGVRSRGGKVIVLRGKPAGSTAAKQETAKAKPPGSAKTPDGDRARSCACTAGGSASDVVEMRHTESGLRVVIIGPDGQTRTRYVPAQGTTARHDENS